MATEKGLTALARTLVANGPHKSEPSPKRVRVLFSQTWIADTTAAVYVWDHPHFPQYYLPLSAFPTPSILSKQKPITASSSTSEPIAHLCALTLPPHSTPSTTLVFCAGAGPLADLVRIPFSEADAWFEEDVEIYVHPKDPYKRVDTLPSRREVRVEVGGREVARSQGGVWLFETGLPVRYYLEKTAVDWSVLTPSETVTRCPYKGEANYYNVTIDGTEYKDAIWWYRYPTPESIAIAGRLCFYNEKVDIYLDGIKQERPKTKFG
ncbi:Protein of unknown function DUF427 [Lasallia pustulata]|uniref:DUF427 domain-containing protein n=1 Tax=Lasallia pustulata TaxID=136370 RepID=A0A1W5CZW1_9LECA|nr:Protein of unknown function DUF427 [Lasallia pustulata]